MKKTKSTSQSFIQGALILSIATVFVKVIGAVYKIPIQNLLGEEGSSYFKKAYDIFATLVAFSTSGLPVAVSKLVSEAEQKGDRRRSKVIFRIAMMMFSIVGTVGMMVLLLGSTAIAKASGSELARTGIMAIAPAIFFICIVSAYRGYHQGMRNMTPTATSQVIEAFIKLVFGVVLVYVATRLGADVSVKAAAAISGVTIGSIASCAYFVLMNRKIEPPAIKAIEDHALEHQKPKGVSRKEVVQQLLKIAIPITISAAVLTLTGVIDTFLCTRNLVNGAGFTPQEAEIYFGAYGWAGSLFGLPSTFINAIAISIVPALTAAFAIKDRKAAHGYISSSMRITALLSLPAAAGYFALSWPIMNLLYGKSPSGVLIAAPQLQKLGIAVFFVCLVTLTNAILQSIGLVSIPVITMLIGAAAKVIVNITLVSNPAIHINGAPIGTIVCYGLVSVLNLFVILRFLKLSPRLLSVFVLPCLAAVGMGACSRGIYWLMTGVVGEKLGVIIAIMVGALVYFALVILLGAIKREDLLMIPKGEKLANALKMK